MISILNIMKYDNLNEFIKRTKSSKSTIYRFYNQNEDLFTETKMKGKKRMYPVDHVRYFDSEIMFDKNKVLRLENNSMRNLIDCLVDKNSLQYTLWEMEWSFFFTVAYKAERNKKSCFRQMHGLYDALNAKYSDITTIRIFFTTEPFSNRTGYHNHFVVYVEDSSLHEEVNNAIKGYFLYDRVDTGIYDKYKAGIFYMSKTGLVNEDWDILGNNLVTNTKLSA